MLEPVTRLWNFRWSLNWLSHSFKWTGMRERRSRTVVKIVCPRINDLAGALLQRWPRFYSGWLRKPHYASSHDLYTSVPHALLAPSMWHSERLHGGGPVPLHFKGTHTKKLFAQSHQLQRPGTTGVGIIACRWFTSEVCGELNKQHVHTANLQQARMQVQTNLPRHIERSFGEWEGLKCVSCEEGHAWALFFQPWHLLCVIRLIMWSWWLSSSAEMGSGLCLEAIQAQGWTPDWGNQRRMRVAR